MADITFGGNTAKIVKSVASTIGAGATGMASQVGVAATATAAWSAIVAAAPFVIAGGVIAGVGYGIKKHLKKDNK